MRVFVITGAGVSAESGIPTFRGKDGYWRNLDPAKLATPEAFARDPQLVWDWYRERRHLIRDAPTNAAHEAIAKLAQHGDEFLLVTQNVDDLHARAGVSPEKMVQIHGNMQRVENFLDRDGCDVVIVVGTTATFGYIIDWALQANRNGGELIEVNPEETPLSRFATRRVREPAAIALPGIVNDLTNRGAL